MSNMVGGERATNSQTGKTTSARIAGFPGIAFHVKIVSTVIFTLDLLLCSSLCTNETRGRPNTDPQSAQLSTMAMGIRSVTQLARMVVDPFFSSYNQVTLPQRILNGAIGSVAAVTLIPCAAVLDGAIITAAYTKHAVNYVATTGERNREKRFLAHALSETGGVDLERAIRCVYDFHDKMVCATERACAAVLDLSLIHI